MITGKLSNGFEITVDENKIKTYRFTKLIGKSLSKDEKEQLYANAVLLGYVIGEDSEEALLEHMSKQLGHEPTEKEVGDVFVEIIKLMKQEDEEIKKSASSDES